MTALVRSELLKLRTTRTVLGLLAGMVALIVLFTLLNGLVTEESYLFERKNQFQLLANGSIASAFAAVLGVLSLTTEFRHGTIRPTFLAEPRRERVLAAKVIALAVFSLALGAVGIGLSYAIGRICISARDAPLLLSGSDIALVLGGAVAATVLWGAFALAIGAVVRNQVGAIVGLLIWSLLVESILFALVPSVGRYLPGRAASVLTEIETAHQLPVTAGVAVFCGYLAVAAVAGVVVTVRRDVA
jgi:ABC-type transport system involved in multi-copper enzyme maturation permease subunit